jgi:CMP-2-keto-3-deoxyoctulosonic acid synthetase
MHVFKFVYTYTHTYIYVYKYTYINTYESFSMYIQTHAIDYQEQLRILRDLCTSTQEMLISTQSDLRKSEEFRKDEVE